MTPELEEITRLAGEGRSSREIGIILGCGKNAVLGRTFRAGIKLGELNGNTNRLPPTPRGGRHTVRRRGYIAIGDGNYNGITNTTRAQAVAAVMLGLSHAKAARAFGVYHISVRNWLHNPVVVALAAPIAEAARADLSERQRAAQLRLDREAREAAAAASVARLERAANNAPILSKLTPRTRTICAMREAGQTLQQIGDHYGFTRERARQIIRGAEMLGIVLPQSPHGVSPGRISTGRGPGRPKLPRPPKVDRRLRGNIDPAVSETAQPRAARADPLDAHA